MPWELIFTSASRGVLPGRKGYCTVAHTEGIPEELRNALERVSSYHHLHSPGSASNPKVCSHRLLNIRARTYHVVSLIQDCGLDYTNRSNYIAHHLAFESDEVAQYASPAAILRYWGDWVKQWDEAQTGIRPTKRMDSLGRIPHKLGPAEMWGKSCTGKHAAAARLMDDHSAAGCLRISLKPGEEDAYVQLFAEALQLANPHGPSRDESWTHTFTTFLQDGENANDFSWCGCIEGTAAHNEGCVLLQTFKAPDNADTNPRCQMAKTGEYADSPEEGSPRETAASGQTADPGDIAPKIRQKISTGSSGKPSQQGIARKQEKIGGKSKLSVPALSMPALFKDPALRKYYIAAAAVLALCVLVILTLILSSGGSGEPGPKIPPITKPGKKHVKKEPDRPKPKPDKPKPDKPKPDKPKPDKPKPDKPKPDKPKPDKPKPLIKLADFFGGEPVYVMHNGGPFLDEQIMPDDKMFTLFYEKLAEHRGKELVSGKAGPFKGYELHEAKYLDALKLEMGKQGSEVKYDAKGFGGGSGPNFQSQFLAWKYVPGVPRKFTTQIRQPGVMHLKGDKGSSSFYWLVLDATGVIPAFIRPKDKLLQFDNQKMEVKWEKDLADAISKWQKDFHFPAGRKPSQTLFESRHFRSINLKKPSSTQTIAMEPLFKALDQPAIRKAWLEAKPDIEDALVQIEAMARILGDNAPAKIKQWEKIDKEIKPVAMQWYNIGRPFQTGLIRQLLMKEYQDKKLQTKVPLLKYIRDELNKRRQELHTEWSIPKLFGGHPWELVNGKADRLPPALPSVPNPKKTKKEWEETWKQMRPLLKGLTNLSQDKGFKSIREYREKFQKLITDKKLQGNPRVRSIVVSGTKQLDELAGGRTKKAGVDAWVKQQRDAIKTWAKAPDKAAANKLQWEAAKNAGFSIYWVIDGKYVKLMNLN